MTFRAYSLNKFGRMPPKRKAGAAASHGGKKVKTAPAVGAAQPSTAQQMVDALKKAGDDRKKTAKVDSYCYQFANNGQVSSATRCITVSCVRLYQTMKIRNYTLPKK